MFSLDPAKLEQAQSFIDRKDQIILDILKHVFGKSLCDLAAEELKERLEIRHYGNGVQSFLVDGNEVLRTGRPIFEGDGSGGVMSIRLKIDVPLGVVK